MMPAMSALPRPAERGERAARAERAESPRPLSAHDERLSPWRAFLAAYALLSRRLDDELQAEQGLSLAEYSALLKLADAPHRRLRMNQLADGVFLSRSGVTRLIDRLETDGLVGRTHCASDGRGAEAVLTDLGLDRLRAASRTHLRGIQTYFLEPIDDTHLGTVEASLTAVGRRVRSDGAGREAACDPPLVGSDETRPRC